MKPFRLALLPLTLTLFVSNSGCSDGETTGSGGTGDASGGTNGSGNASSGGSSGSGAGGSGAGGSGGVDCSGTFASAVGVFEDGPRVTTPALTADELLLFYARGPSGDERFYVAERASKTAAFSPGVPITELDAPCQLTDDRSVDVSDDGLTAYVSCYQAGTLAVPTTLYVLTRASRSEVFGAASEVGSMTPSSSVENDGLSAVWSGEETPSTRLATRSALSEPFGNDTELPGLESTNVFTPDLSPDGLAVYGAIDSAEGRSLAIATRASTDEPFGAPVIATALLAGLPNSGAPELSADCRALYFIGVDEYLTFRVYRSIR